MMVRSRCAAVSAALQSPATTSHDQPEGARRRRRGVAWNDGQGAGELDAVAWSFRCCESNERPHWDPAPQAAAMAGHAIWSAISRSPARRSRSVSRRCEHDQAESAGRLRSRIPARRPEESRLLGLTRRASALGDGGRPSPPRGIARGRFRDRFKSAHEAQSARDDGTALQKRRAALSRQLVVIH